MKATLTFNLPEERDEFERAVKAARYQSALFEIGQRVFRPARKYGYGGTVQRLLDRANTMSTPSMDGHTEDVVDLGTELIGQLEKLFYEIIQEEGIEL